MIYKLDFYFSTPDHEATQHDCVVVLFFYMCFSAQFAALWLSGRFRKEFQLTSLYFFAMFLYIFEALMISKLLRSKVFGRELKFYFILKKKTNLNFSLMNKIALRCVSRLDELIFFNYRRVYEIGQVRRSGNDSRLKTALLEISR